MCLSANHICSARFVTYQSNVYSVIQIALPLLLWKIQGTFLYTFSTDYDKQILGYNTLLGITFILYGVDTYL